MGNSKCIICGKEFLVKSSLLKRGWGKYCSKPCQYKGQLKGKIISCFVCGEKIYRSLNDIKKSKSGKYFCGKSCQTLWRNSMVYFGKNHPNWKGGVSVYKNVLIRFNIPRVCRRCGNNDKRILAVHHLDKNKKNNLPMNLVWLCHNCHFLIHYDKIEYKRFMVAVA